MLIAAGVWWFPPLVLQLAAFVLSAAWGVLIYVISYFAWHNQPQSQIVRLLMLSSCESEHEDFQIRQPKEVEKTPARHSVQTCKPVGACKFLGRLGTAFRLAFKLVNSGMLLMNGMCACSKLSSWECCHSSWCGWCCHSSPPCSSTSSMQVCTGWVCHGDYP